jgi:hypothetical protein
LLSIAQEQGSIRIDLFLLFLKRCHAVRHAELVEWRDLDHVSPVVPLIPS